MSNFPELDVPMEVKATLVVEGQQVVLRVKGLNMEICLPVAEVQGVIDANTPPPPGPNADLPNLPGYR